MFFFLFNVVHRDHWTLNETSSHVRKCASFEQGRPKFGVLPLKRGPQNCLFSDDFYDDIVMYGECLWEKSSWWQTEKWFFTSKKRVFYLFWKFCEKLVHNGSVFKQKLQKWTNQFLHMMGNEPGLKMHCPKFGKNGPKLSIFGWFYNDIEARMS